MRPVDLYRGVKPPSQRFDPCSNPEYQAVYEEASAMWDELEQRGIPKDLILKWEGAQNKLTATEVELMWCFAFNEGMEFQRTIGADTKNCDLSLKK